MKGEAEVQVYRTVQLASNWVEAETFVPPYLQWVAHMFPKGPNHLYPMIREEAPTDVD